MTANQPELSCDECADQQRGDLLRSSSNATSSDLPAWQWSHGKKRLEHNWTGQTPDTEIDIISQLPPITPPTSNWAVARGRYLCAGWQEEGDHDYGLLPGAVVGPAWPALASPTRWCCTAHCCPRGWKPPTGLSANPPCLQREPDWRRPAIPRRSDDSFHKQAQHSLTSGEHLGKPASGQKSFFFGFRLLFIHSLTSVSADKRVILSTRIDYFVGKSLSSLKYTTRLKIHQMAHIYKYCFQTISFFRIQNGGKNQKEPIVLWHTARNSKFLL